MNRIARTGWRRQLRASAVLFLAATVLLCGTQSALAQTGSGALVDATNGVLLGFPVVSGGVDAAVPDNAGGWYIGGSFTAVGGLARSRLAHILADNTVSAWNPGASGRVTCLAMSGTTVYVGGEFTSCGGQLRSRIAAVDAATGLVTSWNPNANGAVRSVAVSGTTVYAGGEFTNIGGQARSRIAALDATTGLATDWNPNASGGVFTVVGGVVVSGTTVYVSGIFASIGAQQRNNIAALDAATGLATAWNPNANARVQTMALSGTTVYAGGAFTSIGGQPRNFIAALDATTGLATAWNPSANNEARTLAVGGTNLYVGGFFMTIGGQPRNFIAALDAATGLVTDWNPNANGFVDVVAVTENMVFAGGSFSRIGLPLPNQPPLAVCQDIDKPADSSCQAVVMPEEVGAGSSDPDGDAITLSLYPPGPYPCGTTEVTLTATDPRGIFGMCTAKVTVSTASELVERLIADVRVLMASGVLTEPQGNGLMGKLEEAIKALESGRVKPAVNKLHDFVDQVESYVNSGKLLADQAQPLIDAANAIVAVLEGQTLPKSLRTDERAASPVRFTLAQNSPNPFNPKTTIRLALPSATEYRLSIYDVAGRLVRRFDGHAGPGEVAIVWDGRNTRGVQQPTGLYFYEARAGQFVETRKMVLAK